MRGVFQRQIRLMRVSEKIAQRRDWRRHAIHARVGMQRFKFRAAFPTRREQSHIRAMPRERGQQFRHMRAHAADKMRRIFPREHEDAHDKFLIFDLGFMIFSLRQSQAEIINPKSYIQNLKWLPYVKFVNVSAVSKISPKSRARWK